MESSTVGLLADMFFYFYISCLCLVISLRMSCDSFYNLVYSCVCPFITTIYHLCNMFPRSVIPAKRKNEGRRVCQKIARNDDGRREAENTNCTRSTMDN